MPRRPPAALLGGLLLLAAAGTLAATTPAAEREQTADQQVRHALSRLAFGPRPGDVERVRALGVDRWIAEQLAPERIPDPRADSAGARYALLALDLPALVRQAPPPQLLRRIQARGAARSAAPVDSAELRRELLRARAGSQQLLGQLASMRVARAVVSDRQLAEVMVDFWSNHFNVFSDKGPLARHYLVSYDRDVIRPHALGRFRDLLGAVATSPAMLVYLDNVQSAANADAPTLGPRGQPRRRPRGARMEAQRPQRGLNENYARELLELHTLGVDGGYTQQDVIEVARALTGWSIAPPQQGGDGGFVFRAAVHDAGAKTVLGVRLKAGRGIEDGEQVLDILARHPSTARFIATKLARRFVHDEPPVALVERAAATFTRTDGDLREVVRTIVTSPEFFSSAAYRAKVKSPFELVVSALRAVGAEADPTPRTAQAIAHLGQPLYGHQAPNGWPETGEAWMNTGAILGRINFGLALAGGSLPGVSADGWPERRTLATASREAQVDAVVRHVLGGAASPDTRAILREGRNPLLAGAATDSLATRRARRREPQGLALLVGLAIGSPEFQRR